MNPDFEEFKKSNNILENIDEAKKIKKHYGEDMLHFAQMNFPTIMENPGLLYYLLKKSFLPSLSLLTDIKNDEMEEGFIDYIYSFCDSENSKSPKIDNGKSVEELFNEAGYLFYKCETPDDVEKFREYYKEDELICTYKDIERRLKRCHVFWAVKENVGSIQRDNFPNPKRDDEYGTSVMSIQFAKGEYNNLSIKNRYNHTVKNPDATLSNNLEKIAVGLTCAFEREYKFKISPNPEFDFELNNYTQDKDGVFRKYNKYLLGMFFGVNNETIYEEKVTKYDPNSMLLLENYIIDFANKTIKFFYNPNFEPYDFVDIKIDKILNKNNTISAIFETGDYLILSYDKNHRITEIETSLKKLNCMQRFANIVKFKAKNIEYVPNDFLNFCYNLKEVDLPNLKYAGSRFMCNCLDLEKINCPNLRYIGKNSLDNCQSIMNVNLPNVRVIEEDFANSCMNIRKIDAPNLVYLGEGSFENCLNKIEKSFPKLNENAKIFYEQYAKLSKMIYGFKINGDKKR